MAGTSRKPSRTPQPGALAGSDFLFHLYRGAELLQENQVHEAKGELENALRLQPREPQGQDLLAQVYFRLGLYPRSISIYESLAEAFPDEVAPRLNLALCYLKTGQPERARDQLERVVTAEPTRQRAWGYLGLAFERLGDYEKARAAFERAGHQSMARRMDSLLQRKPPPPQLPPVEPDPGPDLSELRDVAEAAFHELDATDDAFSLALPSASHALYESGSWFAVELGQSAAAIKGAAISAAPHPRPTPPDRIPEPPAPNLSAEQGVASSVPAAMPVERFARESSLVFPRDGRAARHAGGCVLVGLTGDFAVRLDLAQAMTTAGLLSANSAMMRHGGDGREPVPLGGSTRPLTIITGARRLVLRARPSHIIHVVELNDQSMYIREDALGGVDADLQYDNGRLASGHGDTIALVHVHGSGLVVLELPHTFAAVETTDAAGCVLRCASMLGWVGRVVPRCLPAADAPGDSRGWAAFSGEGSVLFDPACESEF